MTILGLVKSFKTMNQDGPTVTLFDGLFLGKYIRQGIEILTQFSLKSSISLKIWVILEIMRFSAT